MTENILKNSKKKRVIFTPLYLFTVTLLAFSGFGQMPIFKRYYIADIPGLGWLAEFYVTHFIHYACAALLLGLMAYRLSGFLLADRKNSSITLSGYIRGLILFIVVVTGIFLTLKNIPGTWFPPGLIIFLDISHLGFVFLYLLMVVFCLRLKKHWTAEIKKK